MVTHPSLEKELSDANDVHAALVELGAAAHDVGVANPHSMSIMEHGDVAAMTG